MFDAIKARVECLHLQPGDTLVVSTERVLNNEQRAAMRHGLDKVLPGVPVLVADAGIRLSILRYTWIAVDLAAGESRNAIWYPPCQRTTSFDFDKWMAERIAKAHAELMAGPAYRGPDCRAG